ncbi:class I SAM-dependent methyltransferase [Paenibacillus sp. GCM10028914]|uniref:class I SAM-dependent methyltransferase n=1 Tax=Paenibacillus sp. GCM10028914 TaxID=3273416 RepID=UPI00361E358B
MEIVHSPGLKVEDKLGLIQRVLQSGDYDVAVKECCTVFEIVFRKIFQQAVITLPYKERELLQEVERKVGKGTKGVEDLGFGELVGLFRESKLMEKWSKHTSRDMGLIQTLNYAEIVNLRNRITHQGATASRGEANLVYEYLRNLLAMLGFAELDKSINESFKKENTSAADPDPGSGMLHRLPKISKSAPIQSQYSPLDSNESVRLSIQGANYREIDKRGFLQALADLDNRTDLLGLDLGCAGGELTVERFNMFSEFRHVVGVDLNEDKIREASMAGYGDKYTFISANVESAEFEEIMARQLERHGQQRFDVIFSALTLHHLSNPVKALFKLRKLLKPNGCIILRGADDGSKLAYPDEQCLVQNILSMTQEVEGASDRENGRKLYIQLKKAGFGRIQLLYDVKDTVNKTIEERLSLYQGSFSYRLNNFKKRLDQEPDNKSFQDEYNWMKDALEELEVEFVNDTFYYQETVYLAIARQ